MKLQDFRDKIPQLRGLDDDSALTVLQRNYYPDVDRARMAEVLGITPPKTPTPERTWGALAKDVGITAVKGAIGVPEALVGLADIPTGGQVGKFLENEGGDIGFRPKQAKDFLSEGYSAQQQTANQNFASAEGIGGKFQAAIQNPSVVAHTIGESLPAMFAGGGVARGILAAAPKVAGWVAGALGEGVIGAGSAASQIRQETSDGLLTAKQSGLAAATGAATFGFGALGGKVAQKLGIADVDTMLAGAAANTAVRKGVVRSTLEAAVSEGVLEELPQSVSETVLQNLALDKPIDENIDQAIVLGTLAGGVMGGGANLASRAMGSSEAKAAPESTPVNPIVPVAPVAPVVPAGPPPGPLTRAANLAQTIPLTAVPLDVPADAPLDAPIATAAIDPADNPELGQISEPEQVAQTAQTEPVEPTGAQGQFATGQEAQDYISGQRRAASIKLPAALPIEFPDNTHGVAVAGSPDFEEATAQKNKRDLIDAGVQEGDMLNPSGGVLKTKASATNLQKKNGGVVVPVTGGFVVRPVTVPPDGTEGMTATETGITVKEPEIDREVTGVLQTPVNVVGRKSPANQTLPQDLAGAKPRYNYGNKAFTLDFSSDVDRAAMIAAQDTPSKKDAAYLSFAMQATGMNEAEVRAHGRAVKDSIKAQAKDAQPGILKVPQVARIKAAPGVPLMNEGNKTIRQGETVRVADDIGSEIDGQDVKVVNVRNDPNLGDVVVVDAADGERYDMQAADLSKQVATPMTQTTPVKLKTASKEDLDHLFGTDKKRAAAMDRIAKGTAFFGTQEKAKDFITKSGLKDTHTIEQASKTRFEVKTKPVNANPAANSIASNESQSMAQGRSDFAKGTPRTLPSYYTKPGNKNSKDWFRGWDAANVAAPVEPKVSLKSKADDRLTEVRITRRANPGATTDQSFVARAFINESNVSVEGVGGTLAEALANLSKDADRYESTVAATKSVDLTPTAEPKTDALIEKEKAAKAKMLGAAAKLAQLLSKSTRLNITPEQEQAMLPIVIELFEGAMELGFVKFKQAARYVREFLANTIDQDAADSIPMDTLQGAYIATARRHKDKAITPKAEVITIETFDALNDNADDTNIAQAEGNQNEPQQLGQPSSGELEGAQPNALQGTEAGGSTPDGAAGSSGTDLFGSESAGGGRLQSPGRMGNGAGEVSPAATGGDAGGGRGGRVQRGNQTAPRANRPAKSDSSITGRDSGNQPDLIPGTGTRAQDRADGFVITDEDAIGEGGAKTKFKQNIAAIQLLKQLTADNRQATRAEQAVLAKYVGWGGIPQAFARDGGAVSKGWEKEVPILKDAMTPAELSAAAASTRNAHYTSPEIVGALWDSVKRFGFQGGRTLEPSVGVGNFFGLMPTALRSASQLTGVELDHITGGIAKQLYPQANIAAPVGFQDFSAPDNYFDLAIGNPPFGAEGIYDANRKRISGFSIHNYFFAKSIDTVRPNGVLAMVVTNRLLDSTKDKARSYIAERTEFLGAIRLPNDAFAKNAGTQVTTDIIFLRKLKDGEAATGQRWMDVRQFTDKDGKTVPLNEYFVANPDMMLGEFGAYGSMYSPDDAALVARPGQDTPALIQAAIAKLPRGFMDGPTAAPTTETIAPKGDISRIKVGSLYVEGGELFQRREDMLGKQQSVPVAFPSDKTKERVIGMVVVRDALVDVRGLQLTEGVNEKELASSRAALNKAYDAFVKANGPLNIDANKKLMRDDPTWPQIAALEEKFDKGVSPIVARKTGEKSRVPSAQKSAIFSKRTQAPYKAPTKATSAKDAMVSSLAERGRVDLDYMAELYGKSPEVISQELGSLVFKNPAGGWESRDQYLAGNVKKKLAQAIDAAKLDPSLNSNVDALKSIQPADIEAIDIDVKTGAHWVPVDTMKEFVLHITQVKTAAALYNPVTASWTLGTGELPAASVRTRYTTDRTTMSAILEAAANSKQIVIRDKHSDGSTTLNEPATTAANEKVELIKTEWKNWLWSDDARRDKLSRIYNDTFNTDVQREYDGSHLTFPGKVGDDIITLRPHQANAVWRMVQSGTTLLDHVVGAGKTFTMIGGIMEMRRMGLAKKPMLVVPNHLVGQWAEDFMKLYPGANILAATKKDFEKENRKKLFARIATGDWDAVIVAHSSLGKVRIEPAFEAAFIDQQIKDMDVSIAAMREAEGKSSRNVKQIEKQKARLQEKLKKLFDTGSKDDNLNFGELGVDAMLLDEAHEFKNLGFSSGMQRVAGLGNPAGSNKASDMFMKVQLTLQKTGGKNVTFATGTPISNTMAEMYTMQRFLDYGTLKDQGIAHFDAWAKTFGEVVTDWELSPSGQYKMNSRFAKFVNMPELMQRYGSFADVINRDDINRQLAVQGKKLPVPRVKGGKPENTVVERSQDQARYIGIPTVDENGVESYPQGSLVYRAENIPKKAEKGADNMLKIMSDARKAALDMRMIDPSYPDNPQSKVNVAAKSIKDIYDRTTADRGAQLVFSDLSTPKSAVAKETAALRELVAKAEAGDDAAQEKLDAMSSDELMALDAKFSVYDDLKAKLIASGIPATEVAFIHDANTELQKEELFAKVRSGRIRVLLGSTAKMGAGMNVQERLVALHHLDAPWRPSDLEQREGRIIRQGNALYDANPETFEVEIKRYATKQTLDSRMWQTIEAKARFIEQVRKGTGDREVEDVASEASNSAEMKAASSGNPLILEEMSLRQAIRKLDNQQTQHNREQYQIRDRVRGLTEMAVHYDKRALVMSADAALAPKEFSAKIGNQTFDKPSEAGEAILAAVSAMHKAQEGSRELGAYGGFKMTLDDSSSIATAGAVVTLRGEGEYQVEANPGSSPVGLGQRLANTVRNLKIEADKLTENAARNRTDIPKLQAQAKPWAGTAELDEAKARHSAVIDQLKPKKKPEAPAPDAAPPETPAFSRATATQAERNALDALSQNDTMFAMVKSDKKTVADIAAETDPDITVKTVDYPGLVKSYVLTMANGGIARLMVRSVNPYGPQAYGQVDREDGEFEAITERPGRQSENVEDGTEDVYIDVSTLKEGGQGGRIYNIAATFAHNTGRILIGDPAGLSNAAMRRRTEHMLSSALKFGTTRHLAPHPRQVDGASGIGVPPLQWTYGDDLGNIKALIDVSLKSLKNADGSSFTFDLPTGTFRDSSGGVVDDDAISLAVGPGQTGKGNTGITTYKRSAVLSALVRQQSESSGSRGQGNGLLEKLVDVGSQFPASSKGIFYSRGDSASSGRVSEVQSAVDTLTANWANKPNVVVAANMQDPQIPQRVRDYNEAQLSQGATGQPEGFFLGGKVYVIADQLPDDAAILRVLAHESLGHYGLRGLFGDKLNPILKQIGAVRRKEVIAKAEQYGLDLKIEKDLLTAAEEVLAEMAQTQPELGFVKRAIIVIREWLRANVPGLETLDLSKSEILNNYILPARDWVQRGKDAQVAGAVPALSRSAMKSVDANIQRGMASLAEALDEKTTVHRAMFRNGLGWVDFVWGSEGTLKLSGATKGAMGLSHILEARQRKDGLTDGEAVRLLGDIVTTIASGQETSRQEVSGSVRIGVEHTGTAVWLTKPKGSNAWIVTGYRKNPDGPAAGRATAEPTSTAASLTRDSRVAGFSKIVAQDLENGNPDIRFSRTSPIDAALKATVVTDITKAIGHKLADFRSIGLQLLGGRQLNDLYSKDLPQLNSYTEMVQQMAAEANDVGANADKVATAWGNLKDEQQLAELMHDATLEQIDPAKPFVTGDSRAAWDRLNTQFNKLSAEAKKVYTDARDGYEEHYAQVREAIQEKIERSDMAKPAKAAMIERMDGEFFEKIKGVYFPLARFGKYVVVTRNAAGEAVNVSRAESTGEADALQKQMRKDFPASKGFVVGKVLKDREFNAGRDSVGRGFLKDLFGVLDKEGVGAELQDAVNQLYLASMPDLSWAKHGMHRKGTPGFSQDARRAYAQNMFHGARYLSKLRYADQLQAKIDGMQGHVDAQGANEDYPSVRSQEVVDEIIKRNDSLMNPKSSAVSTALTSLGFVFFLGLSPASAAVNLSQTALVAYPIMGAKWGFGKAAAALTRAGKQAAANKNDISSALKGDELRAYEAAVASGTIDVTNAHDLAGISQGEDQGITWKVRPVMKWASFLFHHAERFNRQVTFVASYRLARDAKASHDEAFEQATKATYDGHFDYSASNRPRAMQGPVAKVLTLFKQFGQNMVYTLVRQAQLAMNAETPAGRKEARKALGGILALHASAAGVLGLPLVGPLLAAASMLGGSDDEPWDAEVALRNMLADTFGQKPAEVMARGLSRLTPFDLSGRVALDRLIFPDVQEGLEGQRLAESYALAALGPVGGIGLNLAKGLQEISQGHTLRGFETMMPTALRSPMRALRYGQEGNVDKSGVVINNEISVAGLIGQAAGFAPSEARNAQEGRSAIFQADTAIRARRSTLMREFAQASIGKDEAGKAAARKEIMAFNKVNPKMRILPTQLALSVRARMRRTREAEQGVYLPSNRRESLDAGRFALGDGE